MADSAMSLPASVTVAEGRGGLPVVRVASPAATGEIYLDGATVTGWTPTGADEVLFCSAASRFEAGEPIRGGVPLCAPWFGGGPKNDKTPAHGFFRTQRWELASASEDEGAVALTFELGGDLPADLTARYVVTMGETLDMALTITAGAEDLPLEAALHTYLRVGDIRQVGLEGLDGCRYVDKAPGGRAVNAQSGTVRFTRETDRVYAHEGTVVVEDAGAGRRITVAKEGSASTIVWNPWEGKAARLDDLGDEEWTQMVCVESGNVLRQAMTLAAGQSHTLRQRLSVARA